MNLLLLLAVLPAAICAQQLQKSSDPNDEPFLPIYPQYPYNPKLIKRGLEQPQQTAQPQQPQSLAQLTPELYAPKLDSRDSYTTSYSASPYQSTYETYSKPSSLSPSTLTSSPYYQSSSALSNYGSSPYSLLSSFNGPYNTPVSPYGATSLPASLAASAYPAPGAYPSSLFQNPYYYPNYYGQPPYPPPPYGYPGSSPYKHPRDYDEDDEDDRRREKSKKPAHHKNRLRDADHADTNTRFVDGGNYIISSSKDLDGESSTHRTPSHLNQIDPDSDVPTRAVIIPKATYRLVSVSGPQANDNNQGSNGYIKIQQLEQLMRQALSKLLAQNAAQSANLAAIQQEVNQQQQQVNDNQKYVALPSSIAKTGLSYVVNPTILNRVNPGQYNPSQLLQTQNNLNGNKQPYGLKSVSTVTLQQSPGIYIPPSIKGASDHTSADYGDYDSSDGVTPKSQSTYQATAEPTQARSSYPYSTYRPTQQTSLEDVNFGSKQKSKS